MSERDRLVPLIGQRITGAWIATDSKGDWFNDEPVVIGLGDIQLEIAVYQVGLLAITWNSIDLSRCANWLGCWDDLEVRWQSATSRMFALAIGQRILRIHVADGPSGVDALQFEHDNGVLTLYNACDELGAGDQPLDPNNYRLHSITD